MVVIWSMSHHHVTGVVWVFYARKQEGMSTSESQAIVLGSIKVGGNVVDIQTMAKQHQRCVEDAENGLREFVMGFVKPYTPQVKHHCSDVAQWRFRDAQEAQR